MIWDADFMRGPPGPDGTDSYVLGEINVGSVFRIPTRRRRNRPPSCRPATVEALNSPNGEGDEEPERVGKWCTGVIAVLCPPATLDRLSNGNDLTFA